MNRHPSAALAILTLCAACNFDPSGGSSGPGGGIGGDTDDAGLTGGSDASSVLDDDAAPAPDAEPACGAGCPGTCDPDGTCHILCGGNGGEGGGGGGGLLPGDEPPPCGAVICPPDIPCRVECIGQDACDQPIDCAQATSCRIDCSDDRSCAAQLTCGAGSCEIHCVGSDSCQGGLDCQDSCFCNVSCIGDSSCDPQVTCPAGCDADPECKTTGTGCNDRC